MIHPHLKENYASHIIQLNTHDFWLEGRLDLPPLHLLPLYRPEERMVLDGVLPAVGDHAAQAPLDFLLHELERKEKFIKSIVHGKQSIVHGKACM